MNTWRMMLAAAACVVLVNTANAQEHVKVKVLREQLDASERAYHDAKRQLERQQDIRMHLLKELGPDAMNPEGLVETLRGLDDRLFEARLELHLLEVRREVVMAHVEEHRAMLQAKAKMDEISKLHQAMLERLKNQVTAMEMQFKSGVVSQADLMAKRNEFDRVQIEIAAHERKQIRELGGEVLAELNRELMRTSIDRTVQKALIEQLEKRMQEKRKTLHHTMDQREALSEHNEQLLRKRMEDLRTKMDVLHLEVREAERYFGSKKESPNEGVKKGAEGSSSAAGPEGNLVIFGVYERVVQGSGVGSVDPGVASLSL